MEISVVDLSKKIGKKTILNKVNMKLESGNIYGFCGVNGSGKTVFFKLLCGLMLPTEGKIMVDGNALSEKRRIIEDLGVMIESPGFWDSYTGFENLKVLASIKHTIKDDRICEVLKLVGLYDAKDTKYRKYSLGMKQRLAFAQAIMEYPKVLILDEPSNALDKNGIKMMHEVLRRLKEEGCLICIASHNESDIEELADEIYVVEEGKIHQ